MLDQAIVSNPVDKVPHQLGWMNPLRDDSQGCEGSDVAYFGSHLGWISPPGVVAVPSASRAGEAGVVLSRCCWVACFLIGLLWSWWSVCLVEPGSAMSESGINHNTSAA